MFSVSWDHVKRWCRDRTLGIAIHLSCCFYSTAPDVVSQAIVQFPKQLDSCNSSFSPFTMAMNSSYTPWFPWNASTLWGKKPFSKTIIRKVKVYYGLLFDLGHHFWASKTSGVQVPFIWPAEQITARVPWGHGLALVWACWCQRKDPPESAQVAGGLGEGFCWKRCWKAR